MTFRWETKKRVWLFQVVPGFAWLPDISNNSPDLFQSHWLWFCVDWMSKDWLKFCDDHGGGLVSTFEWLEREIEECDTP